MGAVYSEAGALLSVTSEVAGLEVGASPVVSAGVLSDTGADDGEVDISGAGAAAVEQAANKNELKMIRINAFHFMV